jgi:hypothetical protein
VRLFGLLSKKLPGAVGTGKPIAETEKDPPKGGLFRVLFHRSPLGWVAGGFRESIMLNKEHLKNFSQDKIELIRWRLGMLRRAHEDYMALKQKLYNLGIFIKHPAAIQDVENEIEQKVNELRKMGEQV